MIFLRTISVHFIICTCPKSKYSLRVPVFSGTIVDIIQWTSPRSHDVLTFASLNWPRNCSIWGSAVGLFESHLVSESPTVGAFTVPFLSQCAPYGSSWENHQVQLHTKGHLPSKFHPLLFTHHIPHNRQSKRRNQQKCICLLYINIDKRSRLTADSSTSKSKFSSADWRRSKLRMGAQE